MYSPLQQTLEHDQHKRVIMTRESKRPLIDTGERTGTDQEFANQITHPTRLPYIPNEIIVDILPRLPAKSLLRFRCVCKSWLSLIANKKFRKKHLHMSNDNYSLQRVIFESHGDGFRFKSCSLDSIYSDLHFSPITLDHTITIKDPIHGASMVGSCDGLVCTSTIEGIYLWNPTLRDFRRLPRFKVDLRPHAYNGEYDSFYGFGYDYSIDDYKVVAVTSTLGFPYNNQVDVYTLSSNSWRRIQASPHGRHPICSRGIFYNGALHWPLFRPSRIIWTIIALDLARETYHEIAYPTDGDVHIYNNLTLGVLGGCLCVMMSDDWNGKKTNVWIMKEYGQVNSWTKLACFPSLIDRDFNCHTPRNTPLFVSKNGEMLVIYTSIIYLYNLRDNTFKCPVIPHSLDCTYSATYVESLVSLGVEDSVEGQPET